MNSNAHILVCGGFDPTGEAGILRDSEILKLNHQKSITYITALTVQDNKKGISFQEVPEKHTREMKKILRRHSISGIKIGMIGSKASVDNIISFITAIIKNGDHPFIIWDPIIESTSGLKFLNEPTLSYGLKHLLPFCDLITPNIPELKKILKLSRNKKPNSMARDFYNKFKTPIFLKGGHLKSKSKDFYFDHNGLIEFDSKIITTNVVRGTGCALSTLICIEASKDKPLTMALGSAKRKMNQFLIKKSKTD